MPFLIVLALALLAAIIFAPSLWARWTLRRYGGERPDFPGTGGELARHLLDEAGLQEVAVESVPAGDHYDPETKAVRLEPQHYDGRSLTAVTVAAHEVGHAIQDRDNYLPLKARTELVKKLVPLQKIGSMIILASPVLGLLSRSPLVMAVTIGAGILTLAGSVLVHLV
ncbi:MAG: zinc metallopeptidase, partial [Kiloniellales bacterium]|nr:zinc metallopeptidase [Kiloniellales bacterium]